MKSLAAILKPVVLKEDAENVCDDAFACLDEIITMCNNLKEGLQTVEDDMDESMMNCISSTREHITSACECALEAYGFDACCDTCKDGEEEEEEEEEQKEEKDMGISKDDETEFHKELDDLVHNTFGKRKDESVSGTYSKGTATITSPGNRLHGKTVSIFHKFPDGRINVQYRKSPKKGDVINLTLNKGQYELNESKKSDEPEEAGLKDYVMPKSVTKMLAKQQFNRVKAGTKLFDAVSKVDKKKDLLHLYTSKKHKNILIGMFMIGEKASYFIHNTEAKAKRLDNVGRYKDLKGFVAALNNLFDGGEKNESVKKPLTEILDENYDFLKTTDDLAKLLNKYNFVKISRSEETFKKHNKDNHLIALYGIATRSGDYSVLVGITNDLSKPQYFVSHNDKTSEFKTSTLVYKHLEKIMGAKNEDVKQRTPRALAFVKLLEKHGFAVVPKEHPLYKKYNKSGKLLGLYAIPMRAGKYTDIHIGVTNESYFITDGKNTKSFDNVADLTAYLKKLVASNSLNKLVEGDT